MILFYTPGSCSLACMAALAWAGEPYRLCRVDKVLRGGDAYRRINPRGQVPALRVDGRTLVETDAILAHVADRRPLARLLPPAGTWDRDVANQWMAYLGSGFHPVFWPYYSPHRYVKDESMYASVKQAAVEAIGRELRFVDAHLEGRTFLHGDQRSVLDAYLFSMARWTNKIVAVPADYGNVWRHQKMMARDPMVQLGVSIERAENAAAADAALAASRGSESAPGETASRETASGAFAGHVSLDDLG